jgi:hypothetical protein
MPDLWMDVDTALAEVPVNLFPLIDDTDFKSREVAIAYNQAGMDLVWNFITPAGAYTQTPVTPTTSGNYDWVHVGDGMYSIEIPASGGASINNDTEGFGWFTGICTGVLAWRGPVIGFRAAGLNDALIESAWSATRGLAGTALPAAAADAAGGLPISDAGALDLDTFLGRITGNVALASVLGALADAAADGDPTTADTLMQYVKQVINTLVGTVGIPTFPAAAVAANNVSLAEVMRSLATRLPAALVGARIDANASAVSGDAVAADTLELFAEALDQTTGQLDNGTLATGLDTYQARVELYDDDGGSADRYEVGWYKNGEPVTSGITSPTIQVIKSADGTNLVASTAMTEIGSLGLFKHVEATNRIVAGATYRAKVQATIGGATRTDFKDVGRDT